MNLTCLGIKYTDFEKHSMGALGCFSGLNCTTIFHLQIFDMRKNIGSVTFIPREFKIELICSRSSTRFHFVSSVNGLNTVEPPSIIC